MKFLTLIALFISANTFAADFDAYAFEMAGFSITKNNSKVLGLRHHTDLNLEISKERFRTEKDANVFCKSIGMKLDTEMHSLLLAMSGLANVSDFVKDTIVFKYPASSGIMQWAGKGKETLLMMFDGRGTQDYEVPVSELNSQIDQSNGEIERVNLPAICSK